MDIEFGQRARTTDLLVATRSGSREAFDALMPVVYEELRRLAASQMRRERLEHTLQPTALANEVYLRLVDGSRVEWRDRAQFLAIAARSMRQVLVDHARRRDAGKRGGEARRVTLEDAEASFGIPSLDMIALDEALGALGARDERLSEVVELRFFAGLTLDETAHALGLARTTVEEDWYLARAWLRGRLGGA